MLVPALGPLAALRRHWPEYAIEGSAFVIPPRRTASPLECSSARMAISNRTANPAITFGRMSELTQIH